MQPQIGVRIPVVWEPGSRAMAGGLLSGASEAPARRHVAVSLGLVCALAAASGLAFFGAHASGSSVVARLSAMDDGSSDSNSNAGTPNDQPPPSEEAKKAANKIKLTKMLENVNVEGHCDATPYAFCEYAGCKVMKPGGLASCSCAAVMDQTVYLNLNSTSGFAPFLLAHSEFFVDTVAHFSRGEIGEKEIIDKVCDAMKTQASDYALFPNLKPDLISFPHWSKDRNPYKGFADGEEVTCRAGKG